ncbi:MAG: hypothetical protein IPI46_12365 [Bacteroidetes bacterium]|nr:hypothetical protein [Bacteroidota bacterium]
MNEQLEKFIDFLAKLSDDELSKLMYIISRSGRLIIPNYYFKDHVEEFVEDKISIQEMCWIQKSIENYDYYFDSDIIQLHTEYKPQRRADILEDLRL